jgi:predicted XRE-type DNA-binding protein
MGELRKVWKNTPENFWSQVSPPTPTGCQEWQGMVTKHGYGRVSWHGKKRLSHRVALHIYGVLVDLDDALCVLHRCDNPLCCNPDHLFLGTKKDNTQDAMRKGRQVLPHAKGESSGNAKLTNSQAKEIRQLYKSGELSQQKIADMYGLNQMSISKITRGLAYNDAI